jgi:hypothetical protein
VQVAADVEVVDHLVEQARLVLEQGASRRTSASSPTARSTCWLNPWIVEIVAASKSRGRREPLPTRRRARRVGRQAGEHDVVARVGQRPARGDGGLAGGEVVGGTDEPPADAVAELGGGGPGEGDDEQLGQLAAPSAMARVASAAIA